MKTYIFLGLVSVLLLTNCKDSDNSQQSIQEVPVEETSTETTSVTEPIKNPSDMIPEGYIVFEKISGDLNKDGTNDSILIIKATNPENIVEDEYRGKLDRNRRGIMIFFSKNGKWELETENIDCFSSENEDGGVYFPPELSVEIKKGNLYIHYYHGRYGNWTYTFRDQNSAFELIGYDSSENYGPIVRRKVSINYSTKRKLTSVNKNENAEEGGDEVFEETWEDIKINQPIKLSEIKDFDELVL